MKNYILTILFLSLFSHISLGQIAVSDLRQIKNAPQYRDGEQALTKHLLRLPVPIELLRNSEVCTALGFIKVNKSGKIEEIGILNKVPKLFKSHFIEFAKLTDGNWLPTNEASEFFYVVIPIKYNVDGSKYNIDFSSTPQYFLKPKVLTRSLPSNIPLAYKEDSDYLIIVDEYLANGKNNKAIETLEFLLSRQPFNTDYYKRIIDLYEKAGKKKEVEYYTTLMEVLSDKL